MQRAPPTWGAAAPSEEPQPEPEPQPLQFLSIFAALSELGV